ncbi:exopolysaccharide production protein YjbE [Methylobacterium gnaphalii]|uniref:exopolysaccharide production protein YjbE n=1 Tax=Methylobacterium gnaphalii TaxID=1010610 RepID=UPI0035716ABE
MRLWKIVVVNIATLVFCWNIAATLPLPPPVQKIWRKSVKRFKLGANLAAALLLSASAAVAAPCHTADKGKSPNEAVNPKSSDVDKSSKNTAGGNQPASPGTVGAMNNAGANQATQTAEKDGTKGNKAEEGSKNLAGGNQPASPGTVGAMNDTTVKQTAGDKSDDC